jgi:protein-disulfide isomerase
MTGQFSPPFRSKNMRTLGSCRAVAHLAGSKRVIRGALAVTCIWVSSALAGCSDQKTAAAAQSTAAAPASGSAMDLTSVLATVGDEKVTFEDVRGGAGEKLDQLETQYRRSRDRIIGVALDSIVQARLIDGETKKTGKTPEQLVAAEMNGSPEPSEVEISAWYNENQARLGGRTLDQVRPQIADFLRKEHRTDASKKLDERLRTERPVAVAFEPYRLTFANEGAPTSGHKNAPITLVEFSDFQCPYCQSTAPTLKRIAEKFGDQVNIVYRQYPIPSLHPYATKAAEASLCANDQGKFWQLHDAMFEDQKKLTVSDLKATARRLGIDGKKFDSCLDTGRYVEQVQNDQREAQRVGVTGTPAMFINGVSVDGGAVPYATLESLIQKELARVKAKS